MPDNESRMLWILFCEMGFYLRSQFPFQVFDLAFGLAKFDGNLSVQQFIHYFHVDVFCLWPGQIIDKVLEIQFPNDYLVQRKPVSIGKYGLRKFSIGIVRYGIVIGNGDGKLPIIPLGDVHALSNAVDLI